MQLDVKVDSGGRLTATGVVSHVKVKLSGKSSFQGGGLDSEETDVEAAGGSEATVRITRKLKAKADSGSVVSYSGQKVELNAAISAGSDLRQVHT